MRDYSLGSGGDEDPLSQFFSERKKPTKARKVLKLYSKIKPKVTNLNIWLGFFVLFFGAFFDVFAVFWQETETKSVEKGMRIVIAIDPMFQVKKQALEIELAQPKNELNGTKFLQKKRAISYQTGSLQKKLKWNGDYFLLIKGKSELISESVVCNKKGKNFIPEHNLKEKKLENYECLVAGHPIEEMLPYIIKYDDKTASFLIAIAKKESNWGVYSPQKNGKSCFNYWGYRGTYNQTDSGYSCFDSAEQAVRVVGKRIQDLIEQKIDTPEKMVIWKCGSSCAGHDPAGVRKWISDVAMYYDKAS